jgi:hypothetical protein
VHNTICQDGHHNTIKKFGEYIRDAATCGEAVVLNLLCEHGYYAPPSKLTAIAYMQDAKKCLYVEDAVRYASSKDWNSLYRVLLCLSKRNRCFNCLKENSENNCKKCKIAKYCSLACQSEHWLVHKDICQHGPEATNKKLAIKLAISANKEYGDAEVRQLLCEHGYHVPACKLPACTMLEDAIKFASTEDWNSLFRVMLCLSKRGRCLNCLKEVQIGINCRCNVAKYCSLACQSVHQKWHNLICQDGPWFSIKKLGELLLKAVISGKKSSKQGNAAAFRILREQGFHY